MGLLERISTPADLKLLSDQEIKQLCAEIRTFLVENVSKTGGHLASNLGIVELSVAIEQEFDTSKDRLVFDVGHQCYVHKLLTGRRSGFSSLRQYGGMSGFPKPGESKSDAFIAGHASNSISVALGMARAFELSGSDRRVIALLGDGALTGGMAYEALCDAGVRKLPMIVILNDNGMSITKNVGGMSRHLAHLRIRPGYTKFKNAYRRFFALVPGGRYVYRLCHRLKTALKGALLRCTIFEDMGFQYMGPVDGHDVRRLRLALQSAKLVNGPVFLHVITKKGKGYPPAEANPDLYHGVSSFDPDQGVDAACRPTFSSVFGETMMELAARDRRICAVTAAMTSGTGLTHFAAKYPERFVDTGICEAHAAAMCAGEAAAGAIPVFAVYSTFLQRSFDMLIHDVGIMRQHVVFAVDRAGLVGEDGETHHGIFDLAYLSAVPGMTIYAPSSFSELRAMLKLAIEDCRGPVAVRYPRGSEGAYTGTSLQPAEVIRSGVDVTLVTYGIMLNTALEAAELLEKQGISVEIVKLGILCPLCSDLALSSAAATGNLVVLEDVVSTGCIGQQLAAQLRLRGISVEHIVLKNLGNRFIPQGSNDELYRFCGIDAQSVAAAVVEGIQLGKKKT